MSIRDRIIAAAAVSAIHLLALGFLIGDPSNILDGAFHPQAEAILDGALPYADRGYEYPPLSLPLVLAPGLLSDAEASYRAAFGWEMLGFDLSIVFMLALAVRGEAGASGARSPSTRSEWSGSRRRAAAGLRPRGAAAGFGAVRLAPAALVLGACLARERNRSAVWSAFCRSEPPSSSSPSFCIPASCASEPCCEGALPESSHWPSRRL